MGRFVQTRIFYLLVILFCLTDMDLVEAVCTTDINSDLSADTT